MNIKIYKERKITSLKFKKTFYIISDYDNLSQCYN